MATHPLARQAQCLPAQRLGRLPPHQPSLARSSEISRGQLLDTPLTLALQVTEANKYNTIDSSVALRKTLLVCIGDHHLTMPAAQCYPSSSTSSCWALSLRYPPRNCNTTLLMLACMLGVLRKSGH